MCSIFALSSRKQAQNCGSWCSAVPQKFSAAQAPGELGLEPWSCALWRPVPDAAVEAPRPFATRSPMDHLPTRNFDWRGLWNRPIRPCSRAHTLITRQEHWGSHWPIGWRKMCSVRRLDALVSAARSGPWMISLWIRFWSRRGSTAEAGSIPSSRRAGPRWRTTSRGTTTFRSSRSPASRAQLTMACGADTGTQGHSSGTVRCRSSTQA